MDTRLGSQYTLEALIGRGGAGEVWRGHADDGRALAFKLLRPELAEDRQLISRFIREHHILAGLRHTNIAAVEDLVVEGGRVAIVMQLVEGGDLRRHSRLPARCRQARRSG